jgi:hypothetical protein
MPFTVDDSGLLAGLVRMQQAQEAAILDGLQDGADAGQAEMQATRAHGDQSSATRASYTAYVIGGGRNGAAEAAAGYAAAQAALAGFTGHEGKALSQDSEVVLGPNERGILYTSFTDYQDKLEQENGAEKAVIGPVVVMQANENTARVARRLRGIG